MADKSNRADMIYILKKRSIIALLCGILTFSLAFYGILLGIINTITVKNESGFMTFIYYTRLSNMFAALSAAFIIPFAVEGIRYNRFALPRWTGVIHFMATTSISVTMVFVLALMSWISPEDAFGEAGIFTHVINPLLILISFFQIENGYTYTKKDRFLGIIPFCIYMVVYYIKVVIIGEANGGWSDIYHIQKYVPAHVGMLFLLLLVLIISTSIGSLSNYLTQRRSKRLFSYLGEDASLGELQNEALRLGRMTGERGNKYNIHISYDLLELLAEKYNLSMDDLMEKFSQGLHDALKEKESC